MDSLQNLRVDGGEHKATERPQEGWGVIGKLGGALQSQVQSHTPNLPTPIAYGAESLFKIGDVLSHAGTTHPAAQQPPDAHKDHSPPATSSPGHSSSTPATTPGEHSGGHPDKVSDAPSGAHEPEHLPEPPKKEDSSSIHAAAAASGNHLGLLGSLGNIISGGHAPVPEPHKNDDHSTPAAPLIPEKHDAALSKPGGALPGAHKPAPGLLKGDHPSAVAPAPVPESRNPGLLGRLGGTIFGVLRPTQNKGEEPLSSAPIPDTAPEPSTGLLGKLGGTITGVFKRAPEPQTKGDHPSTNNSIPAPATPKGGLLGKLGDTLTGVLKPAPKPVKKVGFLGWIFWRISAIFWRVMNWMFGWLFNWLMGWLLRRALGGRAKFITGMFLGSQGLQGLGGGIIRTAGGATAEEAGDLLNRATSFVQESVLLEGTGGTLAVDKLRDNLIADAINHEFKSVTGIGFPGIGQHE